MEQAAAGNRISLGSLFESYMSMHCRPHCKRWRDTERCFQSYLSQYASLPAESIRKYDVQKLHTYLGSTVGHTTANRVVQLLRSIYNRAREWDLVLCANPAVGIKLFKLKARSRFLEVEELARFAAAVETLRYRTTRDFLWMCLLTAARRSNVASMRWEDINLERGIWTIPETKNGDPHVLPLVKDAVALLRQRQTQATGPWVFPSHRSRTGHLTKPERAWREIVARSGLQNVRMHDLRRTLASFEAMTGANLLVIAKTLNHRDLKSVQIYGRLQVEPVREAMEAAQQAMFRVT